MAQSQAKCHPKLLVFTDVRQQSFLKLLGGSRLPHSLAWSVCSSRAHLERLGVLGLSSTAASSLMSAVTLPADVLASACCTASQPCSWPCTAQAYLSHCEVKYLFIATLS